MAKAQLISISQAARLTGKARATVIKAAAGLRGRRGKKNAKLYDANKLMMGIYCGNESVILWELDEECRRQ
jgi:hypothetical protein